MSEQNNIKDMVRSVFTRTMGLVIMLIAGAVCMQARTYVLVTGVSNYPDPRIKNLPQATKDAKSIAALFKNKYPDTSLLTSGYANHDNVLAMVRKIAGQAGPNDRIIFFYSGHGGTGFIYLTNGRLTYNELLAPFASSRCNNILLILDTCHSGSIATAMSKLKQSGRFRNNIAAITGSRANETSAENAFLGAGYLTQGLLKGLRGKADADGNRTVTVGEVFRYVYNDVTGRSRGAQHPQLIGAPRLRNMSLMKW